MIFIRKNMPMLDTIFRCPNCDSKCLEIIYEVEQVPVHSVNLVPDREQALAYPSGNLSLGYCQHCTFITNMAFDPEKMEYADDYEETQGYSLIFREFHKNLAEDMISRLGLHGRTVLEIGCGKGEFLELLVQAGAGRGIGFDPAWAPGRTTSDTHDKIRVLVEDYSSKHAGIEADLYCCKMTLEHIPRTREFVQMLRQSIGDRENVNVFFQVPDTGRILGEQAFQDIYYEHCSYFTHTSLKYLFESNGFRVTRLDKVFDDQYLILEAVPIPGKPDICISEQEKALLRGMVNAFRKNIDEMKAPWRDYLGKQFESGQRIVIWGGGSKAVAFLTALNISHEVSYVVDINPHKQGYFLPKTGHGVFSPEMLLDRPADIIIAMNPTYKDEIQNLLSEMSLDPLVISLDNLPWMI